MNKTIKSALPGIGDGILMPMLTHRFKLSLSQLGQQVFGNQVRRVEIDLLAKKIHVDVEQPLADCGLFNEIGELCSSIAAPIVYISHMAGDGNATCRLEFRHCKVIDHKYCLDYAVTEIATHQLVFEFKEMRLVGFGQISR